MKFQVLLLTLVLFAAGCSVKEPGNTVAGHYSGAFAFWLYPSLSLGTDIQTLRAELSSTSPASETVLRQRLVALAEQQSTYNRNLAVAVPPDKWHGFHERMAEALASFDAVGTEVKDSPSQALPLLVDKLDSAHATMRHRVIDCYAQSLQCR
jgi:hypothetical protein